MPHSHRIHADGSFDLDFGGPRLLRAYPGIDDTALHPTRIQIGEDHIQYELPEGWLTLRFESGDSGRLSLHTSITGFQHAPRVIAPIFDAEIVATPAFYHQGLGFGGPSGITPLSGIAMHPARPLNKKEDQTATFAPITSYLCSALVGPTERSVAFGAVDHGQFLQKTIVRRRDTDYGLSNRRCNRSRFTLEITFETDEAVLPATPGLPALHFIPADSPFDALHQLAYAIGESMHCRGALLHPKAKPPTYHFCSWYYGDHSFDLNRLREVLEGLQTLQPKPRLDTIQIDASYFPHVGDWLEPSHNFPGTMREAADLIRNAGYRPGIWIAPFMVGNRSRIAREHPDWLLRDREGQPIVRWKHYLINRVWGLDDEEVLPLDTSHPEAFEYLKLVFQTFRDWGFTFYKTDFMDWGLYDSSTVSRHSPGKTGVHYLREVLEMIRETIGEEAYWLGCILPFPPALGLVDGMRIGNDVAAIWNPDSAGNMVQETLCDQYFNQVWWQNDPDVLYLRDFSTFLSIEENESLALLAAMSGGSINTSDPLHLLSKEGRELWRFIEPHHQHFVGQVPHWADQVDTAKRTALKLLIRRDEHDQITLLAFNSGEQPLTELLSLQQISDFTSAHVHRWTPAGAEHLEAGQPVDRILLQLAPHQSQLFHLNEDAATPPARLFANPPRATHTRL